MVAASSLSTIADELDQRFQSLQPTDRLLLLSQQGFSQQGPGRIVFTTSLGIEDQAITHMIASAGLAIEIATITGLRADQSDHRQGLGFVSYDESRELIKANPLFDWTRDQVAEFVKRHDVPINPLHEQGYVSIGCAPCTRAIKPGEPERAGRWWWEDEAKKECGLHVTDDGRVVRL